MTDPSEPQSTDGGELPDAKSSPTPGAEQSAGETPEASEPNNRPNSSRWLFTGIDPNVLRLRRRAEDAFKAAAPLAELARQFTAEARTFRRAYDMSRMREQIAAAIPKVESRALARAAQQIREQLSPKLGGPCDVRRPRGGG